MTRQDETRPIRKSIFSTISDIELVRRVASILTGVALFVFIIYAFEVLPGNFPLRHITAVIVCALVGVTLAILSGHEDRYMIFENLNYIRFNIDPIFRRSQFMKIARKMWKMRETNFLETVNLSRVAKKSRRISGANATTIDGILRNKRLFNDSRVEISSPEHIYDFFSTYFDQNETDVENAIIALSICLDRRPKTIQHEKDGQE